MVGGAQVLVVFPERAEAEVIGPALAGRIVVARRDGLVVHTSTRTVQVIPADGAQMYSGGYGQILNARDFIVGDRIVAEGKPVADGLAANAIGSILSPLHTHVTRLTADGTVAHTPIGPILLKGGHLPFIPESEREEAHELVAGAEIDGAGWTHPVTGVTYLLTRQ